MIVLSKAKSVTNTILGVQKPVADKKYRPFFYLKSMETEDGLLLFNTMTFELVLLEETEVGFFTTFCFNGNETVKSLIEKWFLVPEEYDDLELVRQVETLKLQINKIYTAPKFNTFTVLPTTDCNARCFYCFERDKQKRVMDDLTAEQAAEFIIKNKADGKINLRWFGGEPLYNSRAIDIICEKLSGENVDFQSSVTTNGYLFDFQMIERAQKLWRLSRVQITLDGTEEKYNRIKNYIHKEDISPFQRVMDNIATLLKSGIQVTVRLNMDDNNADDLYSLTDELLNRFGKYDNLRIYTCLLFEESCAHMKNMDMEKRCILNDKKSRLQEYINSKSKLRIPISDSLENGHAGHCMADCNYAVMILPDGNLGKCQGYIDNHFWGNIFTDKIDFKELNWYKEIKNLSADCDKCCFRPACVVPKCCINVPTHCDDFERKSIEGAFYMHMQSFYKHYKSKNILKK